MAINSDGHIAGDLLYENPFVYRNGSMEVVDLPEGFKFSNLAGLSDLGHLLVLGHYFTGGRYIRNTVVRQPDGTWVKLTPWTDRADAETNGLAISRQGSIVVGSHSTFGLSGSKAMVWRSNVPKPVPGTKDDRSSLALAINDRGDIAGVHDVNSTGSCCEKRPFLVVEGVLTDLPDLGVSYWWVTGLDNLGRVVGFYFSYPNNRAFLYQDGQTMMLDDLVEPAQQGQWQILEAHAINDAGEIAAQGRSTATGVARALKLVPVTAR